MWDYLYPDVEPVLSDVLCHGLESINLPRDQVPDLKSLGEIIGRRTGWEFQQAYGEVGLRDFFQMLAHRQFPLVNELRPVKSLFASAQPDLWHEVFGHLPALVDETMSEIYQGMGHAGLQALQSGDQSTLQRIGKYYWYICEYGLILQGDEVRILGAGLAASPVGRFKLTSRNVNRERLTPAAIEAIDWDSHRYQNSLFVIESLPATYQMLVSEGVLK